MGSQTVKYQSRTFDSLITYPTTENVMSWSFSQEGDGEIYELILNNVASYTVTGSMGASSNINRSNTFPVLTNASYSVAIVKTNNGQAASVTVKTRRSIQKIQSISVPDFGAYSGRYLYVLKSNGVVEKHDTSLFTPANYAGSGVWTSSTLVSTITLPTLPNTAKYSTITFVKNGGVEKMLVHGCEINVYKCYASFIRLSDDTVWNLNFSTQNTYTQIVNSTAIYNSTYLKSAFYDYVGEKVIFQTTSGSQGQAAHVLDLTTLSVTLLTFGSTGQELIANYGTTFINYHRSCSILPTENKYINAVTKFDLTPATYCSIKSNATNKNVCYNRNINAIYAHGDTQMTRVREFTPNGVLITFYNFTNGTTSGQQPIVGYNSNANEYILIAQSVTNNNYAIYRKSINSGTGYILSSPAASSTFGFCLMKSYYNNNWYITGNNAGSGLRRISVINSGQSTPDFGYLDVDSDIYDMHTTQLFD